MGMVDHINVGKTGRSTDMHGRRATGAARALLPPGDTLPRARRLAFSCDNYRLGHGRLPRA